MKSLRATAGKSMKAGVGDGPVSRGRGKLKNKQMAIMDLNAEDDAEDEDVEFMEREQKSLEQLEAALSTCQVCGPQKHCKISKGGKHIALSFGQKRAWAIALVRRLSFCWLIFF